MKIERVIKDYYRQKQKFYFSKQDFCIDNFMIDKKLYRKVAEKEKHYKKKMSQFNIGTDFYNIDVKVNKIEHNDDVIKVYVICSEKIKYTCSKKITFIKTKYILILKKINNVYIIIDECSEDYFQNKPTNLTKYVLDKNRISDNNLKLIDLDRDKMYSYMEKNWDRRPKKWGNFNKLGGDCTNFASQVVFAGGAPMNKFSKLKWYYFGYDDRSPSWTGVNQFYDYMINNIYRGPVGEISDVEDVDVGDIVQLDLYGEGYYSHTLIIDGFLDSYKERIPTLSSHSIDRFNEPLIFIDYYEARYIKLLGYYN